MNNFQWKLEKENGEAEPLLEENVKEEFDNIVQGQRNWESEPILRARKDKIIFSEPLIFDPTHKRDCYCLSELNIKVLSGTTSFEFL